MKKFHFSLQALLTLRQRSEQNALEAYARALLTRQQSLESLALANEEQAQWWVHRRKQLTQGCSAGALEQWRASDCTLTERRETAEAALGQAEVAVNQTLQAMLLARREREAVEKHLQRQRLNYQRELGREEQKNMDDLAQRRVLPALGFRSLQGVA